MHTARSSSRLEGEGRGVLHKLPGPGTLPGTRLPWDHPPGPGTPLDQAPPGPGTSPDQAPPVDRNLDTRYWKYYLAPNCSQLRREGEVMGGFLLADLGGARDAPDPNSFTFMQFSAKNLQNNPNFGSWHTPSGKSWIHHWFGWLICLPSGSLPGFLSKKTSISG